MIQPPHKIHNVRAQNRLVISWPGGQEHSISYAQLRKACQCASCRADHIRGKIVLIPDDLQVAHINQIGPGLQFVFSDGHQRGIFPWRYLFDLGAQVTLCF